MRTASLLVTPAAVQQNEPTQNPTNMVGACFGPGYNAANTPYDHANTITT